MKLLALAALAATIAFACPAIADDVCHANQTLAAAEKMFKDQADQGVKLVVTEDKTVLKIVSAEFQKHEPDLDVSHVQTFVSAAFPSGDVEVGIFDGDGCIIRAAHTSLRYLAQVLGAES